MLKKLEYIWDVYLAPMLINSKKQDAYWDSMRKKYNK